MKINQKNPANKKLKKYAHYKVYRKDSTNPLNSDTASFLLADIDNTDLLGAARTSHNNRLWRASCGEKKQTCAFDLLEEKLTAILVSASFE